MKMLTLAIMIVGLLAVTGGSSMARPYTEDHRSVKVPMPLEDPVDSGPFVDRHAWFNSDPFFRGPVDERVAFPTEMPVDQRINGLLRPMKGDNQPREASLQEGSRPRYPWLKIDPERRLP